MEQAKKWSKVKYMHGISGGRQHVEQGNRGTKVTGVQTGINKCPDEGDKRRSEQVTRAR